MSDLVRKSGAAPRGGKTKEPPVSLSQMSSLLGELPPPPGQEPAVPEATDRLENLYQLAQQEVARILEAARGGQGCDLGTLRRVVTDMVKALATGDNLVVQALEGSEIHFDLSRHMVNLAIFAIKIGQGMGWRQEERSRLGLAACLSDVGMLTVSRPILEKPATLSPDESALVRQHPEAGARTLQALAPEFDCLAITALQHHEREDGSGYPRGLRGDAIHEYAKIAGLADIYEALTQPRPYRKMRVPFATLTEILSAERRAFPDRILKGLIQGLSTFPVGSLVCLNSMEVARVVGTNPALPLRPVLEIIQGRDGERLKQPRRVDLATNALLYVTNVLSPEALE